MITIQQAQSVQCPNCNAQPNQPCTQPTNHGRKPVSWVHLTRESAYQQPATQH